MQQATCMSTSLTLPKVTACSHRTETCTARRHLQQQAYSMSSLPCPWLSPGLVLGLLGAYFEVNCHFLFQATVWFPNKVIVLCIFNCQCFLFLAMHCYAGLAIRIGPHYISVKQTDSSAHGSVQWLCFSKCSQPLFCSKTIVCCLLKHNIPQKHYGINTNHHSRVFLFGTQ